MKLSTFLAKLMFPLNFPAPKESKLQIRISKKCLFDFTKKLGYLNHWKISIKFIVQEEVGSKDINKDYANLIFYFRIKGKRVQKPYCAKKFW